MVEAAWHHGTVNKHTQLIAQGIAEGLFMGVLLVPGIGPLEHAVELEVYVVGNAPAVVTFGPRTRKAVGKKFHYLIVPALVTALIPQAQNHYRTTCGCCLRKGCHITYVLLGIILAVTLVRMERYLHLMRLCLYYCPGTGEKSSIGGEHRHKAPFPCRNDELRQMSMKQRFTHKVEIEEFYPPLQTCCNAVELIG